MQHSAIEYSFVIAAIQRWHNGAATGGEKLTANPWFKPKATKAISKEMVFVVSNFGSDYASFVNKSYHLISFREFELSRGIWITRHSNCAANYTL